MLPAVLLLPVLAAADVDMTLTPMTQNISPTCLLEIDLVLSAPMPTAVAAVDAILSWDPTKLQLITANQSAEDWFAAAFLNDPDGINDDTTDGEAIYTALINPSNPLVVSSGSLVATFVFKMIDDGVVSMPATSGVFGKSRVIGTVPGQDLTGALSVPVVALKLDTPSVEITRLGTPPNPAVFKPGLTSGPVIGQVWDPYVDHSVFFPMAIVDVMGITASPSPIDIPSTFGTILCDISGPILTMVRPAGMPFTLPFPLKCSIIGLSACSQCVSVGPFVSLVTNALDFTIGTL